MEISSEILYYLFEAVRLLCCHVVNTKAMVLGLAARACSVCILLTLAFLTLVNVSLSSSEPTCGARDKAMGSIGRANVNTLNVLGGMLERCSRPGGPVTGFYRDGCCTTGENDL